MSSSDRFQTVSLDRLHEAFGFDLPSTYVMPWDEDADAVDSAFPGPFDGWSTEQIELAERLLAAGITAQHIRSGFTLADLIGESTISMKESIMSDDTTTIPATQYDSGVTDSENTTLAEQIDAVGIEVVTAAIVDAKSGSSVADDVERENVFDPDRWGFVPVLDVFEGDECDILATMCQKTVSGALNPLYVTQQWLDPEGFERLYVSRFPSTPSESGEPGGLGQPVVLYTQQFEDDSSGFVQNLPVAFVKVLTVKAGRDLVSQFRPAPSVEEIERRTAATASVAEKIRRLQNTQF